MVDQIFYLLSAVLLGTVIGALIMYFVSNNKNKDNDPKAAIAEVENKLNAYQEDVSNHFEETADLIDDLTQSYKKVFDHMSKSAKQLMSDEQIQLQIEKRKGNKVTLAFLNEEEETKDNETEVEAQEGQNESDQNGSELNDENIKEQQEFNEQDITTQHSGDQNDDSNSEEISEADDGHISPDKSAENTTAKGV